MEMLILKSQILPFLTINKITYLKGKVSITSNNTVTAWSKAGDLTGIKSTSNVWYLQENDDCLFELYFFFSILLQY